MKMTRNGSANKIQCVVCLRELELEANSKIKQPLNPRKVFKLCTHYLRPEVFTKYSKWDFLNDVERQSPFCSLCVTSGEKLCVMNDRLEELQREIINFVKYFAKEILRHRSNEEEEGGRGQVSSQFLNELNKRTETARHSIRPQNEDSSNSENVVIVKEEIEEHESASEDSDYALPISGDDFCSPTKTSTTSKKAEIKKPPSVKRQKNVPIKITKAGTPSRKNKNRIPQQWTEITISDEQVGKEWKLKQVSKAKSGVSVSEYYNCKLGGRHCPARLLKRTFVGVRFFVNEKPHLHREGVENYGVPPEIKAEVVKMLDADLSVKRGFILESLAIKGVEIPCKRQLVNLLEYERRKRLISSGKYVRRSYESQKSTNSQDSGTSGLKRKRGRPLGSRKLGPPVKISLPTATLSTPTLASLLSSCPVSSSPNDQS